MAGRIGGGGVTVAVVMGSSSDLPVMRPAIDTLELFGVTPHVQVVSAHRDPHGMLAFAADALGRGIEVIIAGAGGAAHLPGMIAAASSLPVIGVPVPRPHLDGLDSLLSIVQMPDGIPVATMGIGGAANAALLAVRILAVGDADLRAALDDHSRQLRDQVGRRNAAVHDELGRTDAETPR
jgi:5-(carboxyamino)imidazole ribonucleotide mutase